MVRASWGAGKNQKYTQNGEGKEIDQGSECLPRKRQYEDTSQS